MIYGNVFLPKQKETASILEFGIDSIVYNEYCNYKNLLESCTDNNTILESKVQILYEISIKDIWDKIKKAWKEFCIWIKELLGKIFNRKKKLEQKEKEVQERIDKAVQEALKNNNGKVNVSNEKEVNVNIDIFEYKQPIRWNIRIELFEYEKYKKNVIQNNTGENKDIVCSLGNIQGKDVPSLFQIQAIEYMHKNKDINKLIEELHKLYVPYIGIPGGIEYEDIKISEITLDNLRKSIDNLKKLKDQVAKDTDYLNEQLQKIESIGKKYINIVDALEDKDHNLTKWGAYKTIDGVKYDPSDKWKKDDYVEGEDTDLPSKKFETKLKALIDIKNITIKMSDCVKHLIAETFKAREEILKHEYRFVHILDKSTDNIIKKSYENN